MPATEGSVERQGDALAFSGALDRAAAAALWQPASTRLEGVQRINLTSVTTVDSAGLALLSALASHMRGNGVQPVIEGEPPGLLELRTAYRLTAALELPAASPHE